MNYTNVTDCTPTYLDTYLDSEHAVATDCSSAATVNGCVSTSSIYFYDQENLIKSGTLVIKPEPSKARYIIEKITMLQPNKTMRVKIYDRLEFGHTPKNIICVVSEPDIFDMYWGCFIALSKYIHGSNITAEGIEYYAKELSFDKLQIKEVNRAIKQYSKEIEAEKKAEKEAQEKKRQLAAKRAKRAVKKAAKAERERLQRVAEFAEGILLAEQMLAPVEQGH